MLDIGFSKFVVTGVHAHHAMSLEAIARPLVHVADTAGVYEDLLALLLGLREHGLSTLFTCVAETLLQHMRRGIRKGHL